MNTKMVGGEKVGKISFLFVICGFRRSLALSLDHPEMQNGPSSGDSIISHTFLCAARPLCTLVYYWVGRSRALSFWSFRRFEFL